MKIIYLALGPTRHEESTVPRPQDGFHIPYMRCESGEICIKHPDNSTTVLKPGRLNEGGTTYPALSDMHDWGILTGDLGGTLQVVRPNKDGQVLCYEGPGTGVLWRDISDFIVPGNLPDAPTDEGNYMLHAGEWTELPASVPLPPNDDGFYCWHNGGWVDVTAKFGQGGNPTDPTDPTNPGDGGTHEGVAYLYTADGDNKGWAYRAGTNFGAAAWSNPFTLGTLGITTNGNNTGGDVESTIVDRQASSYSTTPYGVPSVAFDLGSGRSIQPTDVSYRYRNDSNTYCPTALAVEGSTNGTDWTPLKEVSGLQPAISAWVRITVPSQATYFRYVRVRQIGANNNGSGHFSVGEIELYGYVKG